MFFPPDKKQKSNDYKLTGHLFLDDEKNFTVDPKISYTNDKAEAVWDYYREDPLYHLYHTLLHKVKYGEIT